MLERGFVKVERKLTGWRWYKDVNTFRVFVHLLLTANYEEHDFENITVQRGQRVASRKALANELGISEQKIRTALQHLESTGEITSSGTSKFTVFTINHYDKYQSPTNTSPNDQPAVNQQLTSDQPQCKKDKKDKERKRKREVILHRHGEYHHVLLTEEQYKKLAEEFGEAVIREYIQKIDEWQEARGSKSYKNYALVIRQWMRRDGVTERSGQHDKYAGTAAAEGFI